jgi:DNA replication protein DnaC
MGKWAEKNPEPALQVRLQLQPSMTLSAADGQVAESAHYAGPDPTLADAICDRVVHNAHVLSLKGPSIRRRNGMNEAKEGTTEQTEKT